MTFTTHIDSIRDRILLFLGACIVISVLWFRGLFAYLLISLLTTAWIWMHNVYRTPPRSPYTSLTDYNVVSPSDGVVTHIGLCTMGNRIHNHVRIQRRPTDIRAMYMPINGELSYPSICAISEPHIGPLRPYLVTIIESHIGRLFVIQNPSILHQPNMAAQNCGDCIGMYILSTHVDILIPLCNIITASVGEHVMGGSSIIATGRSTHAGY